jgi:hypothetical protein
MQGYSPGPIAGIGYRTVDEVLLTERDGLGLFDVACCLSHCASCPDM